MTTRAWRVMLAGKEIDIVFYTSDCNADYVRQSLIGHDGYDQNIRVIPCKKYDH